MLSTEQQNVIRHKMIDKKIKSVELAKIIGISKQYLSNLLNGKVSNEVMEIKLLDWLCEEKK